MDFALLLKDVFINPSTKEFLPLIVFLYTLAIVYTVGKYLLTRIFNVNENKLRPILVSVSTIITITIYLIFIRVMNLGRKDYIFDFIPALLRETGRLFEFIGSNSSKVLSVCSSRIYKYSMHSIIKPVTLAIYVALIKFKFVIKVSCRFAFNSLLTFFDNTVSIEEPIYKLECSFNC